MSEHEIIHLSRNPVKLLIWCVIGLACVWLIWNLFTTVLIFSLASLIAYLVTPAIAWLSARSFPLTRKKIPWSFSVLVTYFAIAGLFVAILLVFAPMIISQAETLAASSPQILQKIDDSMGKLQGWYLKLHIPQRIEDRLEVYGESVAEKVAPVISNVAANLAGGILKVVAAVVVLIAAFLVSLYIALEEKNIKRHFLEMFPHSWRSDTEELMHNVGHVVGAFIRGEIFLSLTVGIGSYAGLLLLRLFGVPFEYALLSATVVALLYPIPFIGVWAPRILVPLLAYFQPGGWFAAAAVFVVLTGFGLVVDNAVLPVVMGKGVGISPLMVLLVVFAGGELFGIWGLILSVPFAAVIRLIFFYLQKHVTI